jgi:hypothetical protein
MFKAARRSHRVLRKDSNEFSPENFAMTVALPNQVPHQEKRTTHHRQQPEYQYPD